MSALFNADDVLKIAEQIERNGAKFYRTTAGRSSDANAKEMLLQLAEIEDGHEKVFAGMRARLPQEPKQPRAGIPDAEDDKSSYLKALADRRIFDVTADPSEKLTGSESFEEVLEIALEAERNSIIFYLGIKNMVSEDLGQANIDAIINEEMSHIALLGTALGSARS